MEKLGMEQLGFELPELDRKKTKEAVEAALEKYRICKYLTFDEREAKVTPNYEPQEGGRSNRISDQTGEVATHNVDEHERRRRYCERIERAVRRLPPMERFLLQERYMGEDAQYITDQAVFYHRFDPPISAPKYAEIRWRAFYKLALDLKIEVEKEGNSDGNGN